MDDLIDSMARRHLYDRRYVGLLTRKSPHSSVSFRSRQRSDAAVTLVTARPWVRVNIFNFGAHNAVVVM